MRCGKKAQGSMEFLMTYGWALLVVLVAIGALTFYFGTGSNFLANEGCYMSPGFFCGDFKADEGSVMVKVSNSLGRDLAEISFTHPSCSLGSDNPSLEDDRDIFLTVSECNFGTEGTYMDETFILNYSFLDSTLDHLSDFKVGAVIEGGSSQGMGGGGDSQGGNPGGPGTGYQPDSQTVLLLKFEEGTGTVVYDSSSYGNDGSLTNGPTWETNGYFGTAVKTDGQNDVIRIANDASLNFGNQAYPRTFTIEGWVKDVQDNRDGIMGKRDVATNAIGYSLGVQGGKLAIVFRDATQSLTLFTDDDIIGSDWHHFVFVFDEENDRLYSFVDGVEQDTDAQIQGEIGDFSNNEQFRIGKRRFYSTAVFDEIRISGFARYS